jgi:hypothetical protein
MDVNICESLIAGGKKIACSICNRPVRYYDKLSDGRISCLSCSYGVGFKPSVDCIYHTQQFDPADPDIRVEMIRISQIDIENADKDLCTTTVVIPEDLFEPLRKLQVLHGSTLNAEIVSALGWYATMCLNRNKEIKNTSLDPAGISSVEAEIPEGITAGPDELIV